jgi:uncharacterized Zn-finger protein
MPKPVEILETGSKTVVCDGGGGPLGHPRIFLQIGNDNRIECPYCGRVYKYRNKVLLDTAS